MAMIKCSECGKKVSSKAEKCPSCGAPLVAPKSSSAAGCGCLIVLLGIGWVFYYAFTGNKEVGQPQLPQPKSAPTNSVPDKLPEPEQVQTKKNANAEEVAASQLKQAKALLGRDETEKAKKRFQAIVDEFPDTKAAIEAKTQLEKLQ